eukprot:TRINITY_DN82807_c0_g1_i1.p1 TRINITY_DN82807_c0_g1~~TRINITY_DN82807_c0_g1_i1.p1  ORF type:complete len:377 (+),score=67.84 TRINITY_DN82807_c0_g1_i1:54-1133(+)
MGRCSFAFLALLVIGLPPASAAEGHSRQALPPWWILAGVKPEGPIDDSGSFSSVSFSTVQQKRFGVNATGNVVDWARFAAATAAMKPCIDEHAEQAGMQEGQLMELLGHALEVGWHKAREDDPLLKLWMQRRSTCQRSCMVNVIGWTLRTLWAVGELMSEDGSSSFSRALADAMMACYPSFRSVPVDDAAAKVTEYVGTELRKSAPAIAAASGFAPRSLQSVPMCLQRNVEEEKRSRFIQGMEEAVEGSVSEARQRTSWNLMEQGARPCQLTCRRAVVRQALETLWDSGVLSHGNGDMLALRSIQGAVSACLPNLPRKSSEELAGEALLRFQRPSEDLHGLPSRQLAEAKSTAGSAFFT